jgi:hypothetical protein
MTSPCTISSLSRLLPGDDGLCPIARERAKSVFYEACLASMPLQMGEVALRGA